MKLARLSAAILPLVAFLLLSADSTTALAGPPLICQPIEIGDAESLPWDGAEGFMDVDDDYDASRLAEDVERLLRPATPVLVRMETIRRATIYAAKSPDRGTELLNELASAAASGDPLSTFDYGYAIETFRHAPARMPGEGLDGYRLVSSAASATGDSAMQLALAMISVHPKREMLEAHLRDAIEGAEPGSLLERNISIQFEERARSIAALERSVEADAPY